MNKSAPSSFSNHWKYNDALGCYTNIYNTGYYQFISPGTIAGDHTELTFSSNSYRVVQFTGLGIPISASDNRTANDYATMELSRAFTQFDQAAKSTGVVAFYNDYPGPAGTVCLQIQCLTLPVNTALWYAYYDGATHEKEWYKDSSKNIKYDASEAAKNVTKKALEKLVSTYGSVNTRIYVILYRKQDKYRDNLANKDIVYDYSYLNSNTYKVYDITTESALQNLMKTIASEIKTWGGYKPAEMVQ